jgi:hypothetical protein
MMKNVTLTNPMKFNTAFFNKAFCYTTTLWRLITSPLDLTQGSSAVFSAKKVTEIPAGRD